MPNIVVLQWHAPKAPTEALGPRCIAVIGEMAYSIVECDGMQLYLGSPADFDTAEHLAELESLDSAKNTALLHANGLRYVNVYLEDRAYGGAAEGGWYFDTGQLVSSRAVFGEKEAEALKVELSAEYSNDSRPEINSVLSEGQYAVYISTCSGESYPKHRPHYE